MGQFYLIWLVLVMVLAAGLRLHLLGDRSLWTDEATSAGIAAKELSGLWRILVDREANGGLYYLLLHFWTCFDQGEMWIRGLSVLLSIANVGVVYLLGRQLACPSVGLMAAALLAVNVLHVVYAQQARTYSLLLLLLTLSSLFLVRAIRRPSALAWSLYVAASVLAFYSHIFTLLILGAQWGSLAFLRRSVVPWRPLLYSIISIGCLAMPMFVFLLNRNTGQIDWIPSPHLRQIYLLGVMLTGMGGFLLLLLYLSCALPVAHRAFRQSSGDRDEHEAWGHGLLLIWVFFPILFTFVFSLLFKSIFLARYLTICLPGLVLMAAAALNRISVIWARLMLLAVMVGLSVPGVVRYYRAPLAEPSEDWRSATAYLLHYAHPNDALVLYSDLEEFAYQYYARLLTQIPGPPRLLANKESWSLQLSATRPRVWLMMRDFPPGVARLQEIAEQLKANRYRLVHQRRFQGTQLWLFSSEPEVHRRAGGAAGSSQQPAGFGLQSHLLPAHL